MSCSNHWHIGQVGNECSHLSFNWWHRIPSLGSCACSEHLLHYLWCGCQLFLLVTGRQGWREKGGGLPSLHDQTLWWSFTKSLLKRSSCSPWNILYISNVCYFPVRIRGFFPPWFPKPLLQWFSPIRVGPCRSSLYKATQTQTAGRLLSVTACCGISFFLLI